MGEADSSQEPVKQPIKDGKEKQQKLVNKAGIYLIVGLIVILILAKFPIPWDWVGMATSEEKSQVATEEVGIVLNSAKQSPTPLGRVRFERHRSPLP